MNPLIKIDATDYPEILIIKGSMSTEFLKIPHQHRVMNPRLYDYARKLRFSEVIEEEQCK